MKDTMKALVSYAPYDNRYEDVPVPKIGEGEILLKVKGCGICAGDVKAYHGGIRIWGTSEENRYIEAPCIGGHEFYGEIVEKAQIQHSDVVVIAGLGAIGLSMANMASLCLPKMVIGIDVKENRLAMGKEFGADVVLNPMECNVVEEILKLTDGLGCDVYIEASGSPKSVTQGMDSLKNMGRYVQMGVFAEEVKADWNTIRDGKELKIIGSHLSALTFPAVIKGIENGLIKTDGLISHKFKLEDWKTGRKRLRRQKKRRMR